METFLEFVREALKRIVREAVAHVFRKNVLENKKTTYAVASKRMVQNKHRFLTTTILTVEVVGEVLRRACQEKSVSYSRYFFTRFLRRS